ncbi:MAG: TIR domain-containing protein [Phycisphaerales bacterium]
MPGYDDPRARLREPLAESSMLLAIQLEKGEKLHTITIRSPEDLNRAHRVFEKWSDYTREVLDQMFTTPEFMHEFSSGYAGKLAGWNDRFEDQVRVYRDIVESRVHNLEGIIERLPLIAARSSLSIDAGASKAPHSNKVFVVHGHDHSAKNEVTALLLKVGLEPVVLHEQPNQSRTIIEKFESHADVGFAVVLMTGDDVGGKAPDQNGEHPVLRPRARQNVVMELGFFLGKLGRERTVALGNPNDLEVPSDFAGVLLIPFRSGTDWRMDLLRELRAAGYGVDANRLLVPSPRQNEKGG